MAKIAVILLPGILGSPLDIAVPNNNVTTYPNDAWPVDRLADEKELPYRFYSMPLKQKIERFVQLDTPTLTSRTSVKQATVNANGSTSGVATFYQKFVNQAVNGGYLKFDDCKLSIHVLNYDWTKHVQDIGHDIATETANILTDSSIVGFMYVTHSMGGLVAMEVIIRHKLWKERNFIGAVRVACPVSGAPETLARMHRGIVANVEWNDVNSWFKAIPEHIVGKMLGNEGWRFALLASCIPGLAYLLPSQSCDWTMIYNILDFHSRQPVHKDKEKTAYHSAWNLYLTHWGNISGKMQNSLNGALDWHTLSIYWRKELASCITAVGLSGKTTLQSFDSNAINGATLTNAVYADGDGTVPLDEQLRFSGKQFLVPGGYDHSDAFADTWYKVGVPKNWETIFDAINNRYQWWRDARRGGTWPCY